MLNKRLISFMKESMIYVVKNVFTQWLMLLLNIIMMGIIAYELESILLRKTFKYEFLLFIIIILILRYILTQKSILYSYYASKEVKKTLREKILTKLHEIGMGYHTRIATSSLVQLFVEGIDQLEIYYGSYISQFIYSMLAPFTLFIVLSFINLKVAFILFICVPLIPMTIIMINKIAKRLLSKYWGKYTSLGDSFLENLEGLTTLKIYEADGYKHQKMNEEAEEFRVITMKVLTMQLNSITVMDLVAFGGAALGMIIALFEFRNGNITILESILIILLSADFFIPMRTLGSLFHVAMNGVAASDKLFKFLDEEVDNDGTITNIQNEPIFFKNVNFGYEENKNILSNINIEIQPNQCTSIVGESGCGKSTISSLMMKRYQPSSGEILLGNTNLKEFKRSSYMKHITYLSNASKLFKGTIRDNLYMANPNATDEEMIEVLKKVKIYDYLEKENGLDTKVLENGSNFSGGQIQRISFAIALLNDSNIYIFDEATSNIDVESENDLMNLIQEISKNKTVLMISHRLMNVVNSDQIYVMEKSKVVGKGTHSQLLEESTTYQNLWNSQKILENWKGDQYE